MSHVSEELLEQILIVLLRIDAKLSALPMVDATLANEELKAGLRRNRLRDPDQPIKQQPARVLSDREHAALQAEQQRRGPPL